MYCSAFFLKKNNIKEKKIRYAQSTDYRVDRNNFYKEQKKATIYTPKNVAEFIFKIVSKKIKNGLIFDPCVGAGALLKPFKKNGYNVLGVDIEIDKGLLR